MGGGAALDGAVRWVTVGVASWSAASPSSQINIRSSNHMRCTCGEAERFTVSQPFLLSAPVRPHGQTYHFETVASRRGPWWRFTAGPGARVTLRRVGSRLPISGVSAEVFRLAQLTGLLWWPTISLPIGTSRLLAAYGMAITTTANCTVGCYSSSRRHRFSDLACRRLLAPINAIPVVSRPFTGWVAGESDPPLASFVLHCLSSCQPVTDHVFRSPWSARIQALPRESGEVCQPGCRCYVPKR